MPELSDWAARLQQLTANATRAYSRSAERYQQLLERVARGDITPAAWQYEVPRVWQQQAPALQQLSQLNVEFLADLIRLSSKYREGFLDALVPSGEHAPTEDGLPPFDATNWFQVLSGYASDQSRRSMERFQTLLERVARGEIAPADVQEHMQRFLDEQGPELVRDLVDLGFGFLGRVQNAGYAVSDALYDRLLGPEPRGGSSPVPPSPRITLRGPQGTTVSVSLEIENTRAVAAEVSCTVSEFAPVHAGGSFRALLEVIPPRFVLTPGERRDVHLRLDLEPARFAVDREYVATLFIRGHGEQDLVVEISAGATEPAKNATVQVPTPPTDAPAARTVEKPPARRRSASAKRRRK